MGTAPFLNGLDVQPCKVKRHADSLRVRCACREQLKRVRQFLRLETVKTYTDSQGVKRCVRGQINEMACSYEAGGKHLRSTQAYPGSFGLKARSS